MFYSTSHEKGHNIDHKYEMINNDIQILNQPLPTRNMKKHWKNPRSRNRILV